jgi:hypothetical protein
MGRMPRTWLTFDTFQEIAGNSRLPCPKITNITQKRNQTNGANRVSSVDFPPCQWLAMADLKYPAKHTDVWLV